MEAKQKTFNTWEVFDSKGNSLGFVRQDTNKEWRTFPAAGVQGAHYEDFDDACRALSPANEESNDYGARFRYLEVD